jgi:hypothetical protein
MVDEEPMILMMTLNSIDADPVFHHRARILRKLRRIWLRTSGKPHAAKLLEIVERRLDQKRATHRPSSNKAGPR